MSWHTHTHIHTLTLAARRRHIEERIKTFNIQAGCVADVDADADVRPLTFHEHQFLCLHFVYYIYPSYIYVLAPALLEKYPFLFLFCFLLCVFPNLII